MPNFFSHKTRNSAAVSELLSAAAAGDIARVEELMKTPHNVNEQDGQGRTLLHWAAIHGSYSLAKIVLGDPDIDIKTLDCLGKPAMHYAVHSGARPKGKGNDFVTHAFLEDPWAETRNHVMVCDRHGRTTLHEALDRSSYWVIHKCLRPEVMLLPDARGQTPLHYAARNGNKDAAATLIRNGAKIMARDDDDQTTLHCAARCGNDDLMHQLICQASSDSSQEERKMALNLAAAHGLYMAAMYFLRSNDELQDQHEAQGLLLAHNLAAADMDTRQDMLIWAAERGHTATVRVLLEAGANVCRADSRDKTPLSQAVENKRHGTVEALLKAGAKPDEFASGMTALSRAAWSGHKATISLLLAAGASVDKKDDTYSPDEPAGRFPLSWAAEKGHVPATKLLLEARANVNQQDSGGLTALHRAVYDAHQAVVKLLLAYGADVDKGNADGETPLFIATNKEHEAVVTLLLDHDADVDKGNDRGETPLFSAVLWRHEAMVPLLLQRGADADRPDNRNMTPLMAAASRGKSVQLLLDARAQVNTQDSDRQTALFYASRVGNAAAVELLLKARAKVDQECKDNQTALSIAADRGHAAVVKLLLEGGADVNTRDTNNQTPLSKARIHKEETVARLLLEAGAEV